MPALWDFFAVRADTPSGFSWHWQKHDGSVPVTSAPFEFYFDCVSDARRMGYSGALPAGPKVPLQRLPGNARDAVAEPRLAGAKARSGRLVIELTRVSAVDVERRRKRGRAGVC